MKTSTKFWLCVTGVLLIVLGIVCIAKPDITLISAAWLLGCFTLASGVFKLLFTLKTQKFLPNSGTRMLSALLDIFFGCFFLFHILGTAVSIPVVFAIWVMLEGVIITVQSFDYKEVGFSYWWALLILGVAGALLGFFGLRNLDVTAMTLTTLIGVGIIANGLAYICAVAGVSRFEKRVEGARKAIKEALADEQ